MQTPIPPNVSHPRQFSEKLQEVMNGISDLIELTKESELMPVSEEGVIRYFEESGKCCFQAAGQYERPAEFLQCLLDMVRVTYEPSVLGTFFLNSNPCFLYEAIPDTPFQLAYASLLSQENEPFAAFYANTVRPYLLRCGYDLSLATGLFAVASTGEDRYGPPFVEEVDATLGSGFSVQEAVNLLAAAIDPDIGTAPQAAYSGYSLDPALGSRIRLSVWLFIEHAGSRTLS